MATVQAEPVQTTMNLNGTSYLTGAVRFKVRARSKLSTLDRLHHGSIRFNGQIGSGPDHRSSPKTLNGVVQRRREGPITKATQTKLEEAPHTSMKMKLEEGGKLCWFFGEPHEDKHNRYSSKAIPWAVLDGPYGGSNHGLQAGQPNVHYDPWFGFDGGPARFPFSTFQLTQIMSFARNLTGSELVLVWFDPGYWWSGPAGPPNGPSLVIVSIISIFSDTTFEF